MKAYKYNEEKAMKWLKVKANYLLGIMENKFLSNLKNESSAFYNSIDSENLSLNKSKLFLVLLLLTIL